jgi:MraZ protein
MLSHACPWTGAVRKGGTSAASAGAPLGPRVHGRALGEVVALFLSTHVNKVDRKGRVSVPATFRAALAAQRFPGIVVFPSFRVPALDGSGEDRIEEMIARLDRLDQFSDEYENLSALFAEAQRLPFDPEGRISLPQELADYAGITETAAFVGLGPGFQIWEPGRYAEHREAMRERARRQQTRLPPLAPARRPE